MVPRQQAQQNRRKHKKRKEKRKERKRKRKRKSIRNVLTLKKIKTSTYLLNDSIIMNLIKLFIIKILPRNVTINKNASNY